VLIGESSALYLIYNQEVTFVPSPVVDAELCIACELCVDIAPNTFELNDEGISEVIDPEGDDEDAIQEAIDSCPVEAISWAE